MPDEPLGGPPTVNLVVARNVRRVREGQNLTFSEVVRRLEATGHALPILALRRIEKGERRVTVEDLLALCYALDVAPVDLLVPNDLDDLDDYAVTPDRISPAAHVRDWIAGVTSLGSRTADGSPPPQTEAWGKPANVLRWRPMQKYRDWISRAVPPELVAPEFRHPTEKGERSDESS